MRKILKKLNKSFRNLIDMSESFFPFGHLLFMLIAIIGWMFNSLPFMPGLLFGWIYIVFVVIYSIVMFSSLFSITLKYDYSEILGLNMVTCVIYILALVGVGIDCLVAALSLAIVLSGTYLLREQSIKEVFSCEI